MKKLFAISVCILFAFVGRTYPNEKTYSVEIKNGVRYVHNLRPVSEKPSLSLEFIGKIGELEPKDPNYMFAYPISVAEDGRGNIFILDWKDPCVKKFKPDRTFLTKFGRGGQGPGEFQYAGMVEIGDSGRVVVSTMSSDFHIFDNDGKYIDRFQLPPYQSMSPVLLRGDRLATFALGPRNENSRKNKILKIFDFHGKTLREFGEPLLLNSPMRTWNANFLNLAADEADAIYAAFLCRSPIEKYSPQGQLLISIERTLPYDIEYHYKPATIEVGGKNVSTEDMDFPFVHRGIGLDGRGRLWVLTWQKKIKREPSPKDIDFQDYLAFDIYDEEGIWLMKVPLPVEVKGFDTITVHRDHVFFVDPFDQSCVYEYKIVERSQ